MFLWEAEHVGPHRKVSQSLWGARDAEWWWGEGAITSQSNIAAREWGLGGDKGEGPFCKWHLKGFCCKWWRAAEYAPQNTPLWRKNYFELKAFTKTSGTRRVLWPTFLFFLKAGDETLTWKISSPYQEVKYHFYRLAEAEAERILYKRTLSETIPIFLSPPHIF